MEAPGLDPSSPILGHGALAAVHLLTESPTPPEPVATTTDGPTIAVKVVSKALLVALQQVDAIFREKRALEAVALKSSSPFVVTFMRARQDADTVYLYMQAVLASSSASLDLRAVLDAHFVPLPLDATRCLARCVSSALLHIHSHGVAHRDVKPGNICLDATGKPVVVDFGCARQFEFSSGGSISLVGTLPYMAPEVLARCGHACEADWWSLGVLLVECLSGCVTGCDLLFEGDDDDPAEANDPALQRSDSVETPRRRQWTHPEIADAHARGITAAGAAVTARKLAAILPPDADDKSTSSLTCFVLASLQHEPMPRAAAAVDWAAQNQPPEPPTRVTQEPVDTSDEHGYASLRSIVAGTVAGRCTMSDVTASEDEEEAAWAAAEREELLSRANDVWRRTADGWRSTFDEFGPFIHA